MPLPPGETVLAILFAIAAAILVLPRLWDAFSFLSIYTTHRSTLRSYVYSSRSYALITGASDGIGRALAIEFGQLGFNLIIHGRNREKLERVREEVLARIVGGEREVRLWVQDAAERDVDWEAAKRQWDDLEITVLLNNVGGSKIESETFDQQPLEYVNRVVQVNALFPFHLTHTLLPQLRALNRPTLVLTVGSMAGEIPPPHFAAYASSKAFLDRFIHALDVDERLIVHSKIKFHYLQTATVMNSSGVIKRTGWSVPSSEAYAKSLVRVVGVRRRTVFPWMVHGVQGAIVRMIGERLAERLMISAMKELKKDQ